MRRRLDRQFDALARLAPRGGHTLSLLRRRNAALIRVPIGLILLVGSLLAILPIFGLWMLPLGLLLLAIDLPLLRPLVTTAIIRLRRRGALIRRRLR